MDKTGGYYAKWNKPETDWSHISEETKIGKLIEAERRVMAVRAWREG